jgi:hypothetical protein
MVFVLRFLLQKKFMLRVVPRDFLPTLSNFFNAAVSPELETTLFLSKTKILANLLVATG